MVTSAQISRRDTARRKGLLPIERQTGEYLLEGMEFECEPFNPHEDHAVVFQGRRTIVALGLDPFMG